MGEGRWGGRMSPHARDVGGQAEGEVLGKPAFTTVPSKGSVGKEVDGEGLAAFKPKEGGSLNREALGEKRDSGHSKPPGEKPGSGFLKTKEQSGKSAAETGSKPQGEPGVGIKQENSKGSKPPGLKGAKDSEEPAGPTKATEEMNKPARDGGPGSGPHPGGGGRFKKTTPKHKPQGNALVGAAAKYAAPKTSKNIANTMANMQTKAMPPGARDNKGAKVTGDSKTPALSTNSTNWRR